MQKLMFLITCLAIFPATVFAEDSNSIGYASVQEALDSLKNNPKASISIQGDWTIVEVVEEGKPVLWSFTPASHAAHPAAIKRTIVSKDGAIFIQMRALCQASKVECDKLIEEFKELNEKIKQSVKKRT